MQYRSAFAGLDDTEQLDRAMQAPFSVLLLDKSVLPVQVIIDSVRPVESGVIATITTIVPADQLVFLPRTNEEVAHVEIAVSLFDDAGNNVWFARLRRDAELAREEPRNGTFLEKTELYFVRGKPYRLIVAVRDLATDAVGVAQKVVRLQ